MAIFQTDKDLIGIMNKVVERNEILQNNQDDDIHILIENDKKENLEPKRQNKYTLDNEDNDDIVIQNFEKSTEESVRQVQEKQISEQMPGSQMENTSEIKDNPQMMNNFYLYKNQQISQQKKKKEKEKVKKMVIKQTKKTDFNYKNQSKVKNILDDEEDVGEVGEWTESTANKRYQQDDDFNNEDDEFEKAFDEGQQAKQDNFQSQQKQIQQINKVEQNLEQIMSPQINDSEYKENIKKQSQKANQKAKKIEKGGYKDGQSGGFMVNRLSMKAKFMHLENQEKNVSNQEDDKIIICENEKKSLENMQTNEMKIAEHSEKESADEEEHKDVVIIEPERLSQSPNKKPKVIDEDEWGMINKDTLQNEQLHRRLSSTTNIKQITYIEAWQQVKETDLTNQLILLKKSEQSKQTFFQKLFNMCSRSNGLSRACLLSEKDQILAFSKVKFDDNEQLHFRMLYTIYTTLKHTDYCRRYGNHWEDIGFQGTDPASDLRGTGMLGILQMLAFVSNHKLFLIDVLKYSEHEIFNFPLCITLINITSFVLEYLQSDILDDMINCENQVMNVINKIYFATFYLFFKTYKEKSGTIEKIGNFLKDAKEECGKYPKKCMDQFMKDLDKFYKDYDENIQN